MSTASTQSRWQAGRSTVGRAVALVAAVTLLAAGCTDDPDDTLRVRSTIDDRALADASPGSPIRLDPQEVAVLTLDVENPGSAPAEIARVRLLGELLGLTFLTYDVRVGVVIEAGEQRSLEVPLDFFDLERQANGYLRASVRTYDAAGDQLSSEPLVLDVRGDVTSTLSLFAGLLFVLTVASAVRNVRDSMRGTLPANRFVRGLRFGLTGLGVGLVVSVAFSILRVFALPAAGWVPITLIATTAGFAFGYLATVGAAPSDGDDDEPWDDDERWDDDEPMASATGQIGGGQFEGDPVQGETVRGEA